MFIRIVKPLFSCPKTFFHFDLLIYLFFNLILYHYIFLKL
jgi:hypothetical protein